MWSFILWQKRFKWEDTSFDVCSNDVSVDIKINSDEFALQNQNSHRWKRKSAAASHAYLRAFSLTNLEELSFLTVFALPKASRMGLACSSCFSSSPYQTKHSSRTPVNWNYIMDQGKVHSLIRAGTAKTRIQQGRRAHKNNSCGAQWPWATHFYKDKHKNRLDYLKQNPAD